jgi:hypothetical protein
MINRVTDNEGVNAMHAGNLAIIFAPTLLKPPPGPSSFAISMTNLGKAVNLIKVSYHLLAAFGAATMN